MFHETKNKNKKYFFKSCLQCFSSEKVLNEKKEQILVPFKIYADFECLLKSVDCGVDNDYFSYYFYIIFIFPDHIPCSFAYSVVCIDNEYNKYRKDVVLYMGKNAVFKFINCIFKEYD